MEGKQLNYVRYIPTKFSIDNTSKLVSLLLHVVHKRKTLKIMAPYLGCFFM